MPKEDVGKKGTFHDCKIVGSVEKVHTSLNPPLYPTMPARLDIPPAARGVFPAGVLSCVFSFAYAYSKCTGNWKATLDTREGGGIA
jgi:hypothetical protein